MSLLLNRAAQLVARSLLHVTINITDKGVIIQIHRGVEKVVHLIICRS